MFDQIFRKKQAIERHTNAPLIDERILYIRHCLDNGSAKHYARGVAQYLLVIIELLNFCQIRLVTINDIISAAEQWANNGRSHRNKRKNSSVAKNQFILHASRWLSLIDCLKTTRQIMPFENELNDYSTYIGDEKGLSELGIKGRLCLLRQFLNNIAPSCQSLMELTPQVIDEFMIKKHHTDGCSRCTMKSYGGMLKDFLKYQTNMGNCSAHLAESIRSPRVYKNESIPFSPSWDDVKKILTTTEGDSPIQIRNRPIIMLLSIYGLRSSVVAKLRLDDIDWKRELIYLNRAKNSKPQIFPLTLSVGNALLRYIKEVRQNNSKLREIFLAMHAPYHSLTGAGIYMMVSRKIKPLGLNIKHHGPHSLRHACATHLINTGLSIKEISDHLGHQRVESTEVYLKVDIHNLRKIANLDLGDLI